MRAQSTENGADRIVLSLWGDLEVVPGVLGRAEFDRVFSGLLGWLGHPAD